MRTRNNDLKDEIKKTFGTKLRERRIELNYKTQVDFARALEKSMGYSDTEIINSVKNWEQGRVFPDIDTLWKIADFLECDVDYLIGRMDDHKTHDAKYIHEKTGLSEKTINTLMKCNTANDRRKNYPSIISKIIDIDLDNKLMDSLLDLDVTALCHAIDIETDNKVDNDTNNERLAIFWNASRIFSNILDKLFVSRLDYQLQTLKHRRK
jgi:transcriptional regulator with XRE-family HTH domain